MATPMTSSTAVAPHLTLPAKSTIVNTTAQQGTIQPANGSISPVDPLLAPFNYVASLGSKGIRAKLVDALNEWYRLPRAVVDVVKQCIDMLHNASLLVDDIEDGSELRRGASAAHCVYGVPLTFNCANQVYFLALHKILTLPSVALVAASAAAAAADVADNHVEHAPKANNNAALSRDYYLNNMASITADLAAVYAAEMVELHEGQGMDILWRDTHRCPSRADYDVMVIKKTGGLFRLALRLMMALAVPTSAFPKGIDCNTDMSASDTTPPTSPTTARNAKLITLVETIGVFFQTLDDYLNVSCEEYHQNKSFFEDLTEGKFSYPIIHSINAARASHDYRLMQILKQRPTDLAIKQHCVRLMEETGSLAATRERVEHLKGEVYQMLESLGGSQLIDECMVKMCKLMGVRA